MVVCTPVIYFIVPETKDISLEMIENYFLPNRTRFYVDLMSLSSKRGSIVSTTSGKTTSSKVLTDSQSRIFDSSSDESSDRKSPESIQNTQGSSSSGDICNTDMNVYVASSLSLENSSIPELFSVTASTASSSSTSSPQKQYSQTRF